MLPVCATQNATNQPHRKENENNHLKEVTKLRFRMPSGSIWFISFYCSMFMVQFEASSPMKCCLLELVVEVSLFWVWCGFLSVCLCAIPLPVLNRAFHDGHCSKNNIPNMHRFHSKTDIPILPSFGVGWFSSLPAFTWFVLALARCFPNKFYEHAMCIGCYQ